jgi:hypothetical protein
MIAKTGLIVDAMKLRRSRRWSWQFPKAVSIAYSNQQPTHLVKATRVAQNLHIYNHIFKTNAK